MNVRYVLLDPTKNITALVTSAAPAAARLSVARRIMQKEPSCEQVGFVCCRGGEYRLQMAGGEFCGNASMAAAALFCARAGVLPGQTKELPLAVSGAQGPVLVQVSAIGKYGFACTVAMPPPERIAEERLRLDEKEFCFPTVYFRGIAHCILPADALSRAEAERAVQLWCAALGVQGLGLMLFDSAKTALSPLVYVPAVNTLFWESSCASGTTAVGAYLAQSGGDVDLCVKEPGGTLRIRTAGDRLLLSGSVEILGEREIEI